MSGCASDYQHHSRHAHGHRDLRPRPRARTAPARHAPVVYSRSRATSRAVAEGDRAGGRRPEHARRRAARHHGNQSAELMAALLIPRRARNLFLSQLDRMGERAAGLPAHPPLRRRRRHLPRPSLARTWCRQTACACSSTRSIGTLQAARARCRRDRSARSSSATRRTRARTSRPCARLAAAPESDSTLIGAEAKRLDFRAESLLGQYDLVFAKARAPSKRWPSARGRPLRHVRQRPVVTSGELERLRRLNFGCELCASRRRRSARREIARYMRRTRRRFRAASALPPDSMRWSKRSSNSTARLSKTRVERFDGRARRGACRRRIHSHARRRREERVRAVSSRPRLKLSDPAPENQMPRFPCSNARCADSHAPHADVVFDGAPSRRPAPAR